MPGRFDVVVAGAGLIGAASACLFARQGLTVALVEAKAIDPRRADGDADADTDADADAETGAEGDGRVSALSPAVGHLLSALEVWPRPDSNRVCPYRAMEVWDRNSAAKISFRAADLGEPCLGYIVENRALVAAMLEKLRQNYTVTIIDQTEITAIHRSGDRVGDGNPIGDGNDPAGARLGVALSDGRGGRGARGARGNPEPPGILETRLLVGADGARSRVRALCGVHTRFSDFAQDAIVATLSTARGHRATAWQCFLETGPAALLPLADGRCSLVWSCARDAADELMGLDAGQFRARLQPLFYDELGELTECGARRRFPLAQHHADRYIAESVALVGDAAHLTHPLAGLGANLGFIDAAALAEVVEHARGRGRDIGRHSVLRRYERWRKGDNALALAAMRGFKEIFGSRRAAAKTARSAGMNLADSLPPLKNLLAKYATGLHGDLPALCRRV